MIIKTNKNKSMDLSLLFKIEKPVPKINHLDKPCIGHSKIISSNRKYSIASQISQTFDENDASVNHSISMNSRKNSIASMDIISGDDEFDTISKNFKTSHNFNKKGILKRTFGNVKSTSMRKTALVLFKSALGAGALGLPGDMSRVGIIGQTLIMIACASLLYWILYFMGRISIKMSCKNQSELILKMTQSTTLLYLQFISLFLYCFGTVGLFLKLSGHAIQTIIVNSLENYDRQWEIPFYFNNHQILLQTSTLLFIISSFPQVKQIKQFNFQFPIFSFVQFITIFAIDFINKQDEVQLNIYNLKYFSTDIMDYLNSFTVVLFSFNGIENIFYSTKKLEKPIRRRVKKMIIISKFLELMIYLPLSSIVQLSYLGNTPRDLLDQIPSKGNGYLMAIGNGFFTITLVEGVFGFSIYAREVLNELVWSLTGIYFIKENFQQVLSNFFIIFGSMLLVITVKHIFDIVNIISGVFSIYFVVVLPIIIQNNQYKESKSKILLRQLAFGVAQICTIAGFISGQVKAIHFFD